MSKKLMTGGIKKVAASAGPAKEAKKGFVAAKTTKQIASTAKPAKASRKK